MGHMMLGDIYNNIQIIDVIENESKTDVIAYQCVWEVEGIWKLHALDIIEESRL
jgi:hypothetical protein